MDATLTLHNVPDVLYVVNFLFSARKHSHRAGDFQGAIQNCEERLDLRARRMGGEAA